MLSNTITTNTSTIIQAQTSLGSEYNTRKLSSLVTSLTAINNIGVQPAISKFIDFYKNNHLQLERLLISDKQINDTKEKLETASKSAELLEEDIAFNGGSKRDVLVEELSKSLLHLEGWLQQGSDGINKEKKAPPINEVDVANDANQQRSCGEQNAGAPHSTQQPTEEKNNGFLQTLIAQGADEHSRVGTRVIKQFERSQHDVKNFLDTLKNNDTSNDTVQRVNNEIDRSTRKVGKGITQFLGHFKR